MYDGCAESMSVAENLVVSNIDSFANQLKVINTKKMREHCIQLIKEYKVKTPSEKQKIKSLSGGNIQKAIVAREFSSDPGSANTRRRYRSDFLYPFQDFKHA